MCPEVKALLLRPGEGLDVLPVVGKKESV